MWLYVIFVEEDKIHDGTYYDPFCLMGQMLAVLVCILNKYMSPFS